MLDSLLVLGQIPGTNIELSFWQIVFSVLGTGLAVKIWRRPALRRKYVSWLRAGLFYIQHFRSLRRLLS